MEAPAVTPAALERLRKVIRYHGDKHATLVIRTIIESEGNELALIEPVISAVSQVVSRRPEWPERGLAWIAAFDKIPLLHIVEAIQDLSVFKEASIGTYLAISLENKPAGLLPRPSEAAAARLGPKPPRSVTRIPENRAKIELGRKLLAIRERTPNNRRFGELVRREFDLEALERRKPCGSAGCMAIGRRLPLVFRGRVCWPYRHPRYRRPLARTWRGV
jgi:hypothetical protein